MQKKVHFRRVDQVAGQPVELMEALATAMENYPENAFPTFEIFAGSNCLISKHEVYNDAHVLHLVVYEAGAGAAVIDLLNNAEVGEEPAPDQKEYIISQLFLICSGDGVLWITHNDAMRESRISVTLTQLFSAFCEYDEPPKYMLIAQLNDDVAMEILSEGIEEIDLKAGALSESIEYLNNGGELPQVGIGALFQHFMRPDNAVANGAEDVLVGVSIKPGRDWKKPEVKELLASASRSILDDDDEEGFAIVTKSGLRFTKDKIRLSESVKLNNCSRRVLDYHEVRQHLDRTLRQFREMGIV